MIVWRQKDAPVGVPVSLLPVIWDCDNTSGQLGPTKIESQ
jgi:hypothetical protein